jgi:hypothetical protein
MQVLAMAKRELGALRRGKNYIPTKIAETAVFMGWGEGVTPSWTIPSDLVVRDLCPSRSP